MRTTLRPASPTSRLAALLLVLSLSWLLAGCGDDGGDSDSSSNDDSSESSEPSESEPSESESEEPSEEPSEDSGSDSGSDGDDGGSAADPGLAQFIDGCKMGVDQQIESGTVPEDLRDDLEAVCDSATGTSPADVEQITLETCVVVATGTSPLGEDEARARCEEQLG